MKTANVNLLKMAFYLFIGLSVTLTSCSGEDGEDGIDGTDGINGEQGTAGEDGNANVIASDWFNINWTDAQPLTSSMQIEVPELDMEAFTASGGVVLMYLKITDDNTTTHLLPFEFGNAKFEYGVLNVPDGFDGILVLLNDPDADGLYLEILNNPAFMLRYVLVPATIADANGLINKMPENFGEAATLLGLEQ